MSKKLRRAAKALAGIGAAYLGSKMLGSKMDQMKRAKGIGTSMDTDTEFKGKVSNLTKKGMRREMEDSAIMPKAKPKMDEPTFSTLEKRKSFRSRRGMGTDSGLTANQRRDARLEAFNKKARAQNEAVMEARRERAFRTNVQNFSKGSGKKGVTAKCKLGRNKPTKLY